ncbi:AAA family ATPase [Aerosakkonema funiforme]|uniref:AAA family ATPase n=1 Tax=Aerosakkonema funiforme TaxID=1246630 RepID=UPI0035B848B0
MDNYQILSKIYESANSLVYRAVSLNVENLSPNLSSAKREALTSPHPVILKILKEDYPSPAELTRYKQEYEITKSLQIDGAIEVYDLLPYKNTLAMVLEDFGGHSLDVLLQFQTFSLSEFLSIAIQIAGALGEIHAANIIHKDINPSNIVYNPQTGKVKIIDFGISTKFTRENPTLKNPHLLEGTLAYMSPEQTGRMNRVFDRRTDFYSLGATFYRLLTRKLPFETEDPLELVHCHIAKQPNQVKTEEIPQIISDIVMKLMAKNAEDRYQNALGLKADLEECLHQLQQNSKILNFPLARYDISDIFTIPQKLYGREAEIETLLSIFQKIAEGTGQKSTEMVLVGGYAGIGKSVLIQELYKPITKQRGYFISGKFDQFQRNIPYSAIASAFKSLVQQLLTESDAQLAQWREKLLTALGANGQVIIDLIPEIEQIIGSQPPVQLLEPTETRNRFNTVFLNFLRVFCQKEHPLVIFIDDLQWADSATIKLLEVVMNDRDLGYLMCIGAYRDREVDLNHPLIKMRDRLQEQGAIVNTIILTPLQLEQIVQLIADALHQELESIKPLAELVTQKTSGNPFFINEFLKSLYQENLLIFDRVQKCWQWDIAQIEALGITDNVVDLMLDKLRKLQKATQKALYLAACIGNRFDLTTLCKLCKSSAAKTFQNLLPAIQLGLIQPTSSLEITASKTLLESALIVEEYKFQHDRVQQAAYALIDEDSKQSVHLQIGKLLLKKIGKAELGENLFTLVDHLNKGRALLESDREKIELAELNLRAEKKAKEATAYAASREYLILANDVFPGDIWQERYAMAIDLYKEMAEVEYLNGNFERSEALIEQSIQQAKSAVERAEFYYLRINQYTLLGRYKEAIEVGITALKLLESDLPADNFQAAFEREVSEYRKNLEGREISSLYNSPEMEILEKRAALKILSRLFPTAWILAPTLRNVIGVKAVNLNLKYGHTPGSATICGYMAFIMAHVLHDYRSGYEYTSLGMKLADKYKDSASKAVVTQFHANAISPWLMHIKLSESINAEGADAGLQAGDFLVNGYTYTYNLYNVIYQGKNLDSLLQEASQSLEFARKTQNSWAKNCILAAKIIIQNQLGLTQDKFVFATEETDEADFLTICQTEQTPAAVCLYQIFKIHILYLYGQPPELSYLEEIEKLTAFIPGIISTAKLNFYYSLTLVALYPQADENEQEKYWQKLEANQQRLKAWAEQCPENFQHQYLLVAAEMTRLSGQWYEAINLYDTAIKSAKENEFIHEEALANELAAKFWFAQEKPDFAQIHLKKARQCYQIWGAKRKVEDLDEKYLQWLGSTATDTQSNTIKKITTTGRNSSEALDFAAVMKASQAISGEIVLEQLLDRVMKAAIASAGAEKGFLILDKDGNWVIEAQAAVESDRITILQSIPADSLDPATGIPLLSTAIVNYVARSHENVVLNNATEEGQFTRDAYILATQAKSILCTPLLDRGKLTGILYLENNLAIGAFTPQRVETLKIIAAQAAISIENAQLYEQLENYNRTLEQKVEERTKELSNTLEILKATQAELVIENALLRSAEEPPSYDYQVGGSLPIDAPTYVVRSADRHLYKALRLGQLCYILNTRQMGKSSLRVQIMKKLQAEGFACVAIDISTMSNSQITLEQWYAGFAYLLVSGFNLLDKVNIRTWWRERELLSPVQRLSEFINEVLLTNISEKIIIFIDEIDSVLDLQFDSSAFFGIIRTCYNKRADSSDYQRLNFVLLGVATPSQLIQDRNRTPFNVGQAIQLKGFQAHEAQPLLQGLTKRVTNPQTLLTEVIAWTGGQPFLTQKVCKLICTSDSPIPTNNEATYVEELVRSHIIENWESQDQPEHLRTIRDRILKDKQRAIELLEIYRQILHTGQIVAINNSAETELVMSGLVVKRDDYLQVNNRIYKLVFDDRWIEKQINLFNK